MFALRSSIQPELRLIASPWSPPTWMKQPRVYNNGVLRWEPEILEAYALYLLRFVQAYQAEGLPVQQLHVQNEPNSDQKFPSCVWTGAKMRDFIRDFLGPRFREAGADCEIWAGTIESPDTCLQGKCERIARICAQRKSHAQMQGTAGPETRTSGQGRAGIDEDCK